MLVRELKEALKVRMCQFSPWDHQDPTSIPLAKGAEG